MRCSGGPTPAVSATVTPNGCHVSLVRPALRSRNGTGRGSCPSTSSASPPSAILMVRGALSRYRAGIRRVHRSGSTSKCPSLEIKGGSQVVATAGSPVEGGESNTARAQAGEERPAARRRRKAGGEAYPPYVEPPAEGANEADGPSSPACG